MKFLENILNDLISSPTLMIILGVVYICSTIGKLVTEQDVAKREGTLPPKILPDGLAIFVILGWILFVVSMFINWKVALSVRVLIYLIETTPIIGLIGIVPRFFIMVCIETIFGKRQIKTTSYRPHIDPKDQVNRIPENHEYLSKSLSIQDEVDKDQKNDDIENEAIGLLNRVEARREAYASIKLKKPLTQEIVASLIESQFTKGADNVSQAVDLTIKLLKPNYPGVTRLEILDMYLNEEDDSDDYYEKVIHDDNFRLATMESLVLGRPLSKDIVKVIISSYMKDGNTDVEEIMNLSLKQLKKHYPDLTREKLQYYL